MATTTPGNETFATRIKWNPELLSMFEGRGSVYLTPDAYSDLFLQAKELGMEIQYSGTNALSGDILFNQLVSMIGTVTTHIQQAESDENSSPKAPKPVQYDFDKQEQIAKQLLDHWLVAKNNQKLSHERLSVLLSILALRLRQRFNTTRHLHGFARGKIQEEMRSLYPAKSLGMMATINKTDNGEETISSEAPGTIDDETVRMNRNIPAMEDCSRRLAELDTETIVKLRCILQDIESCKEHIESLKPAISLIQGEEAKYLHDAEFANQLAVLGAPLEFFKFSGEMRNLIYEELFGFDEHVTVTTFKPTGKHGYEGKYRLFYSELFGVSKLFRQEAMSYFYKRNAFSFRSLESLQLDLGMKALAPTYKHLIQTVSVIWTSFNESTYTTAAKAAAKAMLQLTGLKELNIYICWEQVLAKDKTRAGIGHFQSLLLSLRTSLPELKINVFHVKLRPDDKDEAAKQAVANGKSSSRNGRRSRALSLFADDVLTEWLEERLVPLRDPGLGKPTKQIEFRGYESAEEKTEMVRLMAPEELDSKLEEVMETIVGRRRRSV